MSTKQATLILGSGECELLMSTQYGQDKIRNQAKKIVSTIEMN